jgi:hypothetical protein
VSNFSFPHTIVFHGSTYDPVRDGLRLRGTLMRVFHVMADGQWRTLRQLADLAQGSEAGVSARLRDLRKPGFGEFTVERRHVNNGLWEYRLVLPANLRFEEVERAA